MDGRKAIPVAIRSAYAAAFGLGWEVKFCRPASLGEREARAAHAEGLADVEGRIHVITAEVQGQGLDPTHRQAHALAGRWYRWKTERHGEDPGSPQRWAAEIKSLIALRFADLLGQLTTTPARVLDRIAATAEAHAFLARERLALSPDGRRRFHRRAVGRADRSQRPASSAGEWRLRARRAARPLPRAALRSPGS